MQHLSACQLLRLRVIVNYERLGPPAGAARIHIVRQRQSVVHQGLEHVVRNEIISEAEVL